MSKQLQIYLKCANLNTSTYNNYNNYIYIPDIPYKLFFFSENLSTSYFCSDSILVPVSDYYLCLFSTYTIHI